ncbi:MAG: agglutinin biogenesis protein MshI [Sideroxydans sp.]|nr:agglutinin biogenesis protein MshI [Sideroxydans sp.]
MKNPFISKLLRTKSADGVGFALDLERADRGVYCAAIKLTGMRPKVLRCSYHATGKVSPDSLEKVCREIGFLEQPLTSLLPLDDYQILLIEAPVVPEDELRTAIRWKIKDALNFHVDDATVDVLKIPKDGAERTQSLYAIAANNKTIKQRIELFERAKQNLKVIDVHETAQRNVACLFEKNETAVALLAIDEQGGLLTFTAGGELYLSRRIEISAGQMREVDEVLLRQVFNRIELELQRSLDYFDRQHNHLQVDLVLVCAANQTQLVAFLLEMLDVKVAALNLAQVMDISDVPDLADSEFLSHALPVIGAALRQESRAL